jgi:hypothetical protein
LYVHPPVATRFLFSSHTPGPTYHGLAVTLFADETVVKYKYNYMNKGWPDFSCIPSGLYRRIFLILSNPELYYN